MKCLYLLLPFALVACSSSVTEPAAKPSLFVVGACTTTGFFRDGINLTAPANLINPTSTVTGTADATGCDIGVYYSSAGTGTGSVDGAAISGAKYFGVVNNGRIVNVTNSSVSNIGNVPFDGTQHGVAIFYTTENPAGTPSGSASGTVSGNTVSNYQKGGITVRGVGASATIQDNTVTGLGPVDFIAQNGIQVSFGASGLVHGNTVAGNDYTPAGTTSCGILLYQAAGVKVQQNKFIADETNMCNVGKGGGNVSF